MRHLIICAMLLAAGVLLAPQADAFELLMFRRVGCPWCAAWDRQIGPIYPKTELGRRIPIHFIDLDERGGPKFKLASPVHYTPTFVLLDEDREIGRIEGYPGEDFFWARLEALVPGDAAESTSGAAR
jgi:thioredoxin-related protein